MTAEEQVVRIVTLLQRRIHGRGRGTVSLVAEAIERDRNFLGDWKRRKRVELGKLLEALRALELEPTKFFEEALGRLLPEPTPVSPEARACAVRWSAGKEAGQEMTVAKERLEELDELRYTDAAGAFRQLVEILRAVPPELHVLYLAVCASSLRILAQESTSPEAFLRRADDDLDTALWIASISQDTFGTAVVFQRRSYLAVDRGLYDIALEHAEKSAARYAACGAISELGTAVIDRGMWLYHVERYGESIEALEAGLELCSQSSLKYITAAHHTLALAYSRTVNVDKAKYHAKIACRNRKCWPAKRQAYFLWMVAETQSSAGDHSAAVGTYYETINSLERVNYGDLTLATIELARLLLHLGREAEAWMTVTKLRPLLIGIHGNSVITSAVIELLRRGKIGLDLSIVERVIRCLRKHKAERPKIWEKLTPPS